MNVAVALARLGHRSGWAGALGDDEFGQEILAFTRGERVDVSRVALTPEAPTGLYFKETGVLGQLRAYYYRASSAASCMSFADLDLDYLLSGEILHLSGITPALSDGCRDLIGRLMHEANERGTPLSFDANVRWKLFKDKDPQKILSPLIAHADLLFLSDEEAELLLGTSDPEGVREAGERMRARTVVVHGRERAFAAGEGGLVEKEAHPVESVDVVGAGDAFVGGFLSGRLREWDTEGCLELANACGALAVTVPGDTESMPTEAETLDLLHARSTVER